jgi:hypothetical protein
MQHLQWERASERELGHRHPCATRGSQLTCWSSEGWQGARAEFGLPRHQPPANGSMAPAVQLNRHSLFQEGM